MRMRFLSVIYILVLFPLQVSAIDTGLSDIDLEKDDKLMTKILQSLEKVDDLAFDDASEIVGYSVPEIKDILAGKEVNLSSENDFYSSSAEINRVKSVVNAQQSLYRLMASAQTRADIVTWSVDEKEVSPVGDLALSMKRLYCAVASRDGYECGDVSGMRAIYPDEVKGLMAVSDEIFYEAKQLFEDSKIGYHKQTNTFDSGTCKDYSKQKLLTEESFVIKTKPADDVVENDLRSAKDDYFESHEAALQAEFSFSAAYAYLKQTEDRYMGELSDSLADSNSVTNDDVVSREKTGQFSVTGDRFDFLETVSELDAYFTKLRNAMDMAEKDVKIAFPWRIAAAVKDVLLYDKMDELRQVMNGVTSEMSSMADLAEVLANKQQCQ